MSGLGLNPITDVGTIARDAAGAVSGAATSTAGAAASAASGVVSGAISSVTTGIGQVALWLLFAGAGAVLVVVGILIIARPASNAAGQIAGAVASVAPAAVAGVA